ncbi:MAG: type II secretion system protein GspN [Desulfobulbus sp.]
MRETRPGGGRWLRGLGYLLYTLVAAAISLWLLFPAKSVQRFVGRALAGISPGIEWRVGSVKLQLPLMLRVGDVEGYTARNTKTPSLHINRLDIWPDWNTSVREQSLWFGYHLRIGAGVIHGRLQLQTREQKFAFYGTARTLQLESIPLLASRLGRNLQGTVSASYEGKGCPGSQNFCTWKVQCTLENGRLALVRPMLRHTALPFSQVSMLLRGVGRELTIAEGKIASPLGNGWFNGTLLLADDPLQSRLQLRGGLHPQPPFFEGIENTVALQSVRLELQEKPLPFSLSGTLLHPGVHFESLAMQMYALEKEMR